MFKIINKWGVEVEIPDDRYDQMVEFLSYGEIQEILTHPEGARISAEFKEVDLSEPVEPIEPVELNEPVEPVKPVEPVEALSEFKCSVCGFTAASAFGLQSHSKKHK